MAKAVFQRNQKVWVESVGAWAIVEKIDAVWAKGFDEPVRVTYDVGLGRPFQGHELKAEEAASEETSDKEPRWRLMRARNRWPASAWRSRSPAASSPRRCCWCSGPSSMRRWA